MRSAFTIDMEDWYQGIGLPIEDWSKYEKRINIGHEILLNLLSTSNIKATYFVLGKVIEEHPQIINDIIHEGHEVACHSYSHSMVYNLHPDEFEKDIQKCIQLIKKFGISYTGFRAPYFTIDHRSLWALDILKKYNFSYDSSIYPGDSKRTGIIGYAKEMHRLKNDLIEVPVSTFKVFPFDVGLGGAYFRLLPYKVFKARFKSILKQGRPGIFYIHPWELDQNHPRINQLPARIRLPHYAYLKKTLSKLEKLLKDFEFCSMSELIEERFSSTPI